MGCCENTRNAGVASLALLGLNVMASAAYTLTPSAAGQDEITVAPGDSFVIDFTLSSSGGDEHNSSLFQVLFTEPGLEYVSYEWAEPYQNETVFDFSAPLWSELPQLIDGDTLPGGAGQSDIELSNVVPGGETFSTGTIVSLELRVPSDWAGDEQLFVVPLPETFANGFEEVEVDAGTALSVTIIPGPASLLLVGAGMPWALRRRR